MDDSTETELVSTISVSSSGDGGNGLTKATALDDDDRPGSWRRKFTRELARSGNVTRAATVAGKSVQWAYKIRAKSSRFRDAWDRAKSVARRRKVDALESELVVRAIRGRKEPLVSNGKIIGYRRRRSDSLLALALRAESPRKYARRTESRLVGGSPLVTVNAISAFLSDPAVRLATCERDENLGTPNPVHRGSHATIDPEG